MVWRMNTKRVMRVLLTGVAALGLTLSGCSMSGTSGAVVDVDFQARGLSGTVGASSVAFASSVTPASTFPVTDANGTAIGTFTVQSAVMAVDSIDFETELADGSETEVDVEGPFVIDLVAGTVTPEIPSAVLGEDRYTSVWIGLYRTGNEDDDDVVLVDSNDPLYGYSLVVSGEWTPTSGTPRTVTVTSTAATEFEIATGAAGGALQFQAGRTNPVLVAFNTEQWFSGVDFTTIAAGSDPVVLDAASASLSTADAAILAAFQANVKASGDMGFDDDDDGEVDHEEDD